MSIAIWTYHDPYKLNKERVWPEICNCPYFCAAQTLANGLHSVYDQLFSRTRVKTVRNLTDGMFLGWRDAATMVKQHADLDNITNYQLFHGEEESSVNLRNSFLFNREEVLTSIRSMIEMNMSMDEILHDKLTDEQKYLVLLYRMLMQSDKASDFVLKSDFTESDIDQALENALRANLGENDELPADIDFSRIVIHGVHQFTPLILRAIDEISKYKKVILLFNYQNQYHEAYQTWIDIYTAFDRPIIINDENEFHPQDGTVSFFGNELADNVGKLINGQAERISNGQQCQIIEFDNMTEFANYIADIFSSSQKKNPARPMDSMVEQFYAADSSANDILKIYFPEQFGERQFLDYPIGHFFISIANMWSQYTNQVEIRDITDVKECLSAHVLNENAPGELLSIFERMEALFTGCSSLESMIDRLHCIRKSSKYLYLDVNKREFADHISYYNVSTEDVDKLTAGLQDLESISSIFFKDFESTPSNFKKFYDNLRIYLRRQLTEDDKVSSESLDEEFADILKRVLERLDQIENLPVTASFECLKATMSIYLQQESKPGRSANWIIRGFEQIDGDILRSSRNENAIYHFACLSDEDISSVSQADFSWPLNDDFFEVAQNPLDWKYLVYVKSRKEYKNFKRYALLYGLEFNRGRFKLSYVRNKGVESRSPLYLLKMLGIEVNPYRVAKAGSDTGYATEIPQFTGTGKQYNEFDLYRNRMCRYRFLLESVGEGTTVYKDEFLIMKYMEVVLENKLLSDMQGMPYSEDTANDKLHELYDDTIKMFPFAKNSVTEVDTINAVKSRIKERKIVIYPFLSDERRRQMMIRKLFIHQQLSDRSIGFSNVLDGVFTPATGEQIDKAFSSDRMNHGSFPTNKGVWCQYCAERTLCIATDHR